MTFDAIAGYVDHSTVSTREIYAFPTTLSILRQYAQKALCIKTPLSRGETGKTLTDTENKKKNYLPIFRPVCHRQPSNKHDKKPKFEFTSMYRVPNYCPSTKELET